MHANRKALSKIDQISRALLIAKSLGVRSAAGYLRRCNFSIEAALWLLVYRSAV